jgi:hypothetical protein
VTAPPFFSSWIIFDTSLLSIPVCSAKSPGLTGFPAAFMAVSIFSAFSSITHSFPNVSHVEKSSLPKGSGLTASDLHAPLYGYWGTLSSLGTNLNEYLPANLLGDDKRALVRHFRRRSVSDINRFHFQATGLSNNGLYYYRKVCSITP